MNCNELATVQHYDVPVVIVLFNNRTLGMVRQWQNLIYDKRFSQTDLDRGPDFVKLAGAYGIDGARVQTQEEFEDVLRRAFASGKPWFIECAIDKDEMVHPMVSGGSAPTNFLLD
jgi:acetolactate synthase-1/2/3 large subunit